MGTFFSNKMSATLHGSAHAALTPAMPQGRPRPLTSRPPGQLNGNPSPGGLSGNLRATNPKANERRERKQKRPLPSIQTASIRTDRTHTNSIQTDIIQTDRIQTPNPDRQHEDTHYPDRQHPKRLDPGSRQTASRQTGPKQTGSRQHQPRTF